MTVGLVLVSHSRELATATAAMCTALAGTDVRIEPAGGTDDGRFGTSIDLIRSAVERADHGSGVCVLMDMGSSVLTAKTLLAELTEDLPADQAPPLVRLVDAPFVEGAVAAAVTASTGQDVDAVVEAAEQAWAMRKL